jgi:hypothetical protein
MITIAKHGETAWRLLTTPYDALSTVTTRYNSNKAIIDYTLPTWLLPFPVDSQHVTIRKPVVKFLIIIDQVQLCPADNNRGLVT